MPGDFAYGMPFSGSTETAMTQRKKHGKRAGVRDETLEERIHRHLADKSSEISEEDIRNVRTTADTKSAREQLAADSEDDESPDEKEEQDDNAE